MSFLEKYSESLNALRENKVYPFFPVVRSACGRTIQLKNEGNVINFASCDYLGLANDSRMKSAAIEAIEMFGTNISGSIGFSGYTQLHHAFEEKMRTFFGKESCLMFTTSYLANVGTISTLTDSKDIIFMDKLSHSSLIQGSMLSRAKVRTYKHKDMNMLESLLKQSKNYKKRLIVTDGLFSADGDFCPLSDIVYLANKYYAQIFLDDAHGIGIEGDNGKGTAEKFSVLDQVDFIVGTMSKALGSTGGFFICNNKTADILKHMCPTYISSRAVSPGVAAASVKALDILNQEGVEKRKKLAYLSQYILNKLRALDINCLDAESAIVPVTIGEPIQTARAAKFFLERGILTSLFVPPVVPAGTSRLRLGISYFMEKTDIFRFIEVAKEAKNLGYFA